MCKETRVLFLFRFQWFTQPTFQTKCVDFLVHLLFNHNHKDSTRFQPNHLISGSNMTKKSHPQKGCPVENPKSMAVSLLFSNQPRCQVRSPTAEGWPPVKRENVVGRRWSSKRYLGILEVLAIFFWEVVDFKLRKSGSENLWPYQLMIFPNISSKSQILFGSWWKPGTSALEIWFPEDSKRIHRDRKHPGIPQTYWWIILKPKL